MSLNLMMRSSLEVYSAFTLQFIGVEDEERHSFFFRVKIAFKDDFRAFRTE